MMMGLVSSVLDLDWFIDRTIKECLTEYDTDGRDPPPPPSPGHTHKAWPAEDPLRPSSAQPTGLIKRGSDGLSRSSSITPPVGTLPHPDILLRKDDGKEFCGKGDDREEKMTLEGDERLEQRAEGAKESVQERARQEKVERERKEEREGERKVERETNGEKECRGTTPDASVQKMSRGYRSCEELLNLYRTQKPGNVWRSRSLTPDATCLNRAASIAKLKSRLQLRYQIDKKTLRSETPDVATNEAANQKAAGPIPMASRHAGCEMIRKLLDQTSVYPSQPVHPRYERCRKRRASLTSGDNPENRAPQKRRYLDSPVDITHHTRQQPPRQSHREEKIIAASPEQGHASNVPFDLGTRAPANLSYDLPQAGVEDQCRDQRQGLSAQTSAGLPRVNFDLPALVSRSINEAEAREIVWHAQNHMPPQTCFSASQLNAHTLPDQEHLTPPAAPRLMNCALTQQYIERDVRKQRFALHTEEHRSPRARHNSETSLKPPLSKIAYIIAQELQKDDESYTIKELLRHQENSGGTRACRKPCRNKYCSSNRPVVNLLTESAEPPRMCQPPCLVTAHSATPPVGLSQALKTDYGRTLQSAAHILSPPLPSQFYTSLTREDSAAMAARQDRPPPDGRQVPTFPLNGHYPQNRFCSFTGQYDQIPHQKREEVEQNFSPVLVKPVPIKAMARTLPLKQPQDLPRDSRVYSLNHPNPTVPSQGYCDPWQLGGPSLVEQSDHHASLRPPIAHRTPVTPAAHIPFSYSHQTCVSRAHITSDSQRVCLPSHHPLSHLPRGQAPTQTSVEDELPEDLSSKSRANTDSLTPKTDSISSVTTTTTTDLDDNNNNHNKKPGNTDRYNTSMNTEKPDTTKRSDS